MPAERVEDNDVLELWERMKQVAPRVRAGAGPHFFEVMTYRWREHVGPATDYQLGFRSEKEWEPWRDDDQVQRLAELVEPAARALIQRQVEEEVAEAFAFAEASPAPGAEELYSDLFKE
jgi:TPP-dependent pyruvate/acetoin dehydrogenase alpha subunit